VNPVLADLLLCLLSVPLPPGKSGYKRVINEVHQRGLPRHSPPTHGSTQWLYSTLLVLCNTYPPTMSNNQQSFRSQLSSFRWANSVQDDSTPPPQSNNVFSRTWTGLSGYIPLRNEGRSQEEEAYFALSVCISWRVCESCS